MILVLSGEGPSDIGRTEPAKTGWEFVPGPMAWMVDRLLERRRGLGYSMLETHACGGDCIFFLSAGDLAQLRRSALFVIPKSNLQGKEHFRKAAMVLGKHAGKLASELGVSAIAVLFHDADGTQSSPAGDWHEKFESIRAGFQAAEFSTGVPMVPRPKSEAWMLCGLLKHRNPDESCHWLEGESGNDASPNSLKKRLANHLGHDPTAEEQADLVRSGQVDPEKIDLPSFLAFRDALDAAFANAVTGQ